MFCSSLCIQCFFIYVKGEHLGLPTSSHATCCPYSIFNKDFAHVYVMYFQDEDSETPAVPKDAEKLVELTEESFHDHVKTGKHFVKFYAPWCGHCQVDMTKRRNIVHEVVEPTTTFVTLLIIPPSPSPSPSLIFVTNLSPSLPLKYV